MRSLRREPLRERQGLRGLGHTPQRSSQSRYFREPRGDGAAHTLPDGPEIELANAEDLRGGAAYEQLVRHIELIAGERLLANLVAEVLREDHDAVAGQALEHCAAVRRVDDAFADREEVLTRALGHEAGGIEHERLIEAEARRLGASKNRVAVVPRELRFRHHDVRVMPGPGTMPSRFRLMWPEAAKMRGRT